MRLHRAPRRDSQISSEVPMHPMTGVSSYLIVVACVALAAAGAPTPAQSQGAAPLGAAAKLDYDFFKGKVQQVFLTKRPAPFHLVSLSPGATSWNEEQSRQNFELVQRVA